VALKILLADDSMTAQKLGMKILVDAGYQVIAVSNGAAAVKKIASEKPDLAVLDIYMPGYTGLEVCERVRAAAETARIPVLLTVGKMEMGTFKPEDANRVKADGVIIKPFEATDLLAAVKKIEEKLAAAPAEEAAAYEKTAQINVAEMLKKDSSYQEWQVTADEHKDEEPAESGPVKAKTEVPADMASDAAMAAMFAEEEEPVEARAAALETPAPPAQYATAPSVAVEPVAPPIPLETAPNTQQYEAPAAAPHRDPELEPTSAKHHVEVGHAPDPHFEPTVSQDRIEVEHVKDPALVTDAAEMATAFVTKFGVDNPEPISVGVAADANIPGLYSDGTHAEGEATEVEQVAAEEPAPSVGSEAEKLVAEAMASMDKQPAPAAPPPAEDDFEQRVAAKMSTYEAPVEASAAPPEVKAPPEPDATAEIAAIPPAPAAEAAPAGGWAARETSIAHHELNASLDQEMLKAFSAALPAATPEAAAPAPEPEAAAPAPVAVPAPAPAPSAPVNAPDIDLARAMAAAVAPDAPPAADAADDIDRRATIVDPAKLADAIHRALDRLKPDLIANIARELEKK
jgi:CheY-like chemotaxis protein